MSKWAPTYTRVEYLIKAGTLLKKIKIDRTMPTYASLTQIQLCYVRVFFSQKHQFMYNPFEKSVFVTSFLSSLISPWVTPEPGKPILVKWWVYPVTFLVIRSNFTSNTHENGYTNTVYNMLAALVIARRSKKKPHYSDSLSCGRYCTWLIMYPHM